MDVEFTDYYKVLGVDPSASAADIKHAYKKLARKYHPDVSKEADALVKFQDVSDAYDNLKNDEKRDEYDQLRAYINGESQHFNGDPNLSFDDLLSSIFGRTRPSFNDYPVQDSHHTLEITLEEAYHGGARQLRISGRQGEKTINVNITKGITAGKQLRLAGQGELGPGGKTSDMYLEITLAPHPRFTSNGTDVNFPLQVSPWQAALGASIPVPTLGGEVSLKIPENSQTGSKLRLKGRGLSNGDQIVTLNIVNPRIISDEQKQAFEQLQTAFFNT